MFFLSKLRYFALSLSFGIFIDKSRKFVQVLSTLTGHQNTIVSCFCLMIDIFHLCPSKYFLNITSLFITGSKFLSSCSTCFRSVALFVYLCVLTFLYSKHGKLEECVELVLLWRHRGSLSCRIRTFFCPLCGPLFCLCLSFPSDRSNAESTSLSASLSVLISGNLVKFGLIFWSPFSLNFKMFAWFGESVKISTASLSSHVTAQRWNGWQRSPVVHDLLARVSSMRGCRWGRQESEG